MRRHRKNIYTHCLLFLAITFSFIILSTHDASSATVGSVIEGHNTCDQCHGRYPGGAGDKAKKGQPANIPADNIDLLCLGCHGPAGISILKADIHGAQNYVAAPIGCIDCHDPHDNVTNYVGGQNIQLIGNEQSVVFESRGTDTGESALYSFADGDMDKDGRYSGICEVCHTKTKFHKNNPSGDHTHYAGQTCTNCHVHVNQFLAFSDGPITDPEISGTIIDDLGNTWANIVLFIDLNGNGVYDEGEPLTVSDANGNFVFKGITNKGHYILVMPDSLPNGYKVKISIVNNVVVVKFIADKMRYPTRLSWKADGGYFAADFQLNALFFYDSTDKLTNRLDGMDKPLGVATDDAGRIYVGNEGRRNIEIYNAAGDLQQTIGNGQLKKPTEIDLDRDQRVYVVDSTNKQVRVFNPDGSDRLTLNQAGPNGNFRFPISLAIHYRMEGGVEAGELYVADRPSSLIHVYDLQGTYLRSLGGNFKTGMMGPKISNDRMHNIQSIAFDQNGNLHALDSYMSRVIILDPVDGTGVGYYDTFQTDQGSQLPMDIAINETGQVIMTSFKTQSVQHIHTVQ